MKTTSDFMSRISLSTIALSLFAFTAVSRADWVAFNDHSPGSGTSTNATTNSIRLQTSGPLKNIANGTNLPATLAITTSGTGITYNNSGASPAAGNPLGDTF